MNKIVCSNLKCLFRNEETGECYCDKVELAFSSVQTIWQGRKDILECRSFRPDDEYVRLKEIVEEMMEEGL